MKRWAALILLALAAACQSPDEIRPRHVLFVGIDVSGSFRKTPQFNDALEFLSYYLHGHLTGAGELHRLRELFVGSLGGESVEEAKAFHPIHDFRGKSPAEIQADLQKWFPPNDRFTDFNIFFKQVAHVSQQRNLALCPITVLLVTDGMPDMPASSGTVVSAARYEIVDLSPMEFLSRNVTLRLLYVSPVVGREWDSAVARRRVRLWTADDQVMAGWKAQLAIGLPPERQERFWAWVRDNVDFRVRAFNIRSGRKN
ncbi:MAG TPA: hypothetical protein DEB40_10165 [Elusimicrobia bacterium]|nr:hypothetical protein [Elusimicrobiota bacterium]HBT62094.1 hypothetical protein [Elusimicrobiota bacterium]